MAAGDADRLTVVAAETGEAFSYGSRVSTVAAPEHTAAVTVCAPVVKTRWLGGAGLTVSTCVAEARPAADAVTVMLPGAVPLNQKLAALVPAAMETEPTAVVQDASE